MYFLHVQSFVLVTDHCTLDLLSAGPQLYRHVISQVVRATYKPSAVIKRTREEDNAGRSVHLPHSVKLSKQRYLKATFSPILGSVTVGFTLPQPLLHCRSCTLVYSNITKASKITRANTKEIETKIKPSNMLHMVSFLNIFLGCCTGQSLTRDQGKQKPAPIPQKQTDNHAEQHLLWRKGEEKAT